MPSITFQKIQSELNKEFFKEDRRIVFWYDEKKEWTDQINLLELQNAEILFADGTNQFELKYKIEYENPDINYLIYAPLPKPDPNKDHLLDIYLYSREFKADGLALFAEELSPDLAMDKNRMALLEKYSFFFRNTANQNSFRALEIDNYDNNSITLGMLCCLCDFTEQPMIQNLIVHILKNGDINNNKYIQIFSENNLTDVFWGNCRNNLGWQEESPTLEKMLITIYLTYFKRDLYEDLPEKYKPFKAQKTGNVTQILENLKNYKQKYQEYADYIAGYININEILQKLSVDSIVNCSVFKEVDKYITDWVTQRLINNDLGALANKKPLDIICDERRQKNAGTPLEHDYQMLKNAALLLFAKIDGYSDTLETFIDDYAKNYYKPDLYYRHFIENYDKLEDNAKYEELQNYIENYYTNSFLAKYISAWNKLYITGVINTDTCRVRKFYSTFVSPLNKKTVVVISDALRYEAAVELSEIFKIDQNCTVDMKYMLGELPSITSLGMASLLPNDKLDIALDGKVLCDGKQTDDLAKRRSILQSVNKNSECIQYNDFFQMKRDDMRSLLKNIDILYVYHNQIDSRGENLPTEKDVFNACRSTINELYEKIKYLGKNANVYHFVIVSDHGFIYKREKLTESDKIGDVSKLGQLTSRRFILSGKQNQTDGICAIKIGDLLENDNSNYILFPESVNVFKCSGGQNYVHGGSSPQELIIPVIDIDIEKYTVETRPAEIRLSRAIKPRINNLITTFEFLQIEAVSSEIKPETYEIYIAEIDNANKTQLLSDIQTITANKTGVESSDRLFKLTFNLKNQEYPKDKIYYLIIRHKDSTMELSRTEVIIDIAFAGNFGFFKV